MRLTERKVCYPQCDTQGNLTEVHYIENKDKKLAEEKLCQLEDIEDELGIDLVKLIECVRNEKGIWKKDFNGGLINTRCMLTCYFGKWQIYDKENIYELKDYGKTWALTKEELL